MNKILVLYVFHIYNKRVEKFINNCIFYDNYVDFMIISNDKNNNFDVPNYVMKFFRDNIGYDFGGWSEALLSYNLYTKYDNFIFVNSSVIGPFLHTSYKGKWTDIYLNGLKDNVKLFGSTINCCNNPINDSHIQSYIFSMDKTTLQYLIDCEIFSISNYAKNFHNAIFDKEKLMSKKILEMGWNIGSLFPLYKNVDFTFTTKKPSDYNFRFLDDIMFEEYRGSIWNEYELVFIKGNRIKSISI
jgi:hypothetical protein